MPIANESPTNATDTSEAPSAVIIGYGGIGQAIAHKLNEHHYQLKLISRRLHHQPYRCISVDVSRCESVDALADCFNPLPSLVIVTCGKLSDGSILPEKSISHCQVDALQQSITDNVLPALHVSQALHRHLSRHHQTHLVIFSARVSSITDNRLGGWHRYRMSKCMLNMLIKNIAIEWKHHSPASWVIGYHPGTVETELSKPFIGNVPAEKRFTPQQAAAHFVDVINMLKKQDQRQIAEFSGQLFDWQGEIILP